MPDSQFQRLPKLDRIAPEMNPPLSAPTPPPRLRVNTNLAIACLTLGILGLLSSPFMVGALFSLLSLGFGVVHLMRRTQRNGLAWTGILLSLLALVVSGLMGALAYNYVNSPEFKEVWEPPPPLPPDNSFANWQGVMAPDFSVTTLNGKALKLSDLKGKRVVVNFWATWDPPCLRQVPHLVQLRKESPANQLVIVGISTEDVNTLKSFAKESDINYSLATAESLPSPYQDVSERPTTFFLDRNGVIQSVLVGYQDFEILKTNALAADFDGAPKPTPR